MSNGRNDFYYGYARSLTPVNRQALLARFAHKKKLYSEDVAMIEALKAANREDEARMKAITDAAVDVAISTKTAEEAVITEVATTVATAAAQIMLKGSETRIKAITDIQNILIDELKRTIEINDNHLEILHLTDQFHQLLQEHPLNTIFPGSQEYNEMHRLMDAVDAFCNRNDELRAQARDSNAVERATALVLKEGDTTKELQEYNEKLLSPDAHFSPQTAETKAAVEKLKNDIQKLLGLKSKEEDFKKWQASHESNHTALHMVDDNDDDDSDKILSVVLNIGKVAAIGAVAWFAPPLVGSMLPIVAAVGTVTNAAVTGLACAATDAVAQEAAIKLNVQERFNTKEVFETAVSSAVNAYTAGFSTATHVAAVGAAAAGTQAAEIELGMRDKFEMSAITMQSASALVSSLIKDAMPKLTTVLGENVASRIASIAADTALKAVLNKAVTGAPVDLTDMATNVAGTLIGNTLSENIASLAEVEKPQQAEGIENAKLEDPVLKLPRKRFGLFDDSSRDLQIEKSEVKELIKQGKWQEAKDLVLSKSLKEDNQNNKTAVKIANQITESNDSDNLDTSTTKEEIPDVENARLADPILKLTTNNNSQTSLDPNQVPSSSNLSRWTGYKSKNWNDIITQNTVLKYEKIWDEINSETAGIYNIADPLERNKRITEMYDSTYEKNHNLLWAKVANYASKQVGCGMGHANKVPVIGNKVAELLGNGNREVFWDIYPMLRFYNEFGLNELKQSLSNISKHQQKIIAALEKIDAGDIDKGTDMILEHEQRDVLQIMYDDPLMGSIVKANHIGNIVANAQNEAADQLYASANKTLDAEILKAAVLHAALGAVITNMIEPEKVSLTEQCSGGVEHNMSDIDLRDPEQRLASARKLVKLVKETQVHSNDNKADAVTTITMKKAC